MRRRHAADDYEYDESEEEESTGRWSRGHASGRRRWLWLLLVLLVIPLLVGAGVALVAGRPIAFDVIRRMTDRKFPSGRWVTVNDLDRWRADPGRAQPVLLDARTQEEYGVSHLLGAQRIDPYRPILASCAGSRRTRRSCSTRRWATAGREWRTFWSGRATLGCPIWTAGCSNGSMPDDQCSGRTAPRPRYTRTTRPGGCCSSRSTGSRRRRWRRSRRRLRSAVIPRRSEGIFSTVIEDRVRRSLVAFAPRDDSWSRLS